MIVASYSLANDIMTIQVIFRRRCEWGSRGMRAGRKERTGALIQWPAALVLFIWWGVLGECVSVNLRDFGSGLGRGGGFVLVRISLWVVWGWCLGSIDNILSVH